MTTQPEALRLADLWEKHSHGYARTPEARTAAELRRLHEENGRLRIVAEMSTLLLAQRDALLGLLKEARKIIRATSSRNLVKDWDRRTTAAIKAVEEKA